MKTLHPKTSIRCSSKYPHYKLKYGGRVGWTALAVAIEKHALPLILHILNKEPRLVNAGWGGGQNIPYIVSAANISDPNLSKRVVQEFLSRGANVNLASDDGDTALYTSSQ